MGIKNEVSAFFDITYSEERTIITMHGMAEHGGVLTKVAMYDDQNRPAPMNRATHGMLMDLDAMNNIVFQKEVKMRREGDEPYMTLPGMKKFFS